MGIFNNILGRMGYQKINTVVAPENMYMEFLASKIGHVQNETVSAVYKCISTIATYLSILPIGVSKQQKLQSTHQLHYLLKHEPNTWQNPQVFWSLSVVHLLYYGNTFLWIHRNSFSGKVSYFEILHPQWIAGYNFVEGQLYYYYDQSKNPDSAETSVIPIHAADLVHIKDINTGGIWGLSRMQAAADNAQILGKAGKTISNFYDNNAWSTMVMEGKLDGLDPTFTDTLKESIADFKKNQTGIHNAGKIISVPWNQTIKTIPVNYVDVQLIETMKFTRDQVYTVFGLVDFFKEGNNVNIGEQLLQFKNFTIVPVAGIITAELEYKLLTKAEKLDGLTIAYNYNKLIDADFKTKADIVKLLVSNFIMTPAEGAEWLGVVPATGEYANYHYGQKQYWPLELYQHLIDSEIKKTEPKNTQNDGNQ